VDLFKLELRNFFGVLLPGALLLLVILYASATALIAVTVTLIMPESLHSWINGAGTNLGGGGHEALVIALLFLLSYLLGSLLKLNSADNLDERSGKANMKKMHERATRENKKGVKQGESILSGESDISLDEVWESLTSSSAKPIITAKNYEGLWARDTFPYPVFQLWRLKRNRLTGYLETLYPLLLRMKEGPPVGGQKSLFNYCKMLVFSASKELGDELIREVRSTETEVRFYAGTYYALFCGLRILALFITFQIFILFAAIYSGSLPVLPGFFLVVLSFIIAGIACYGNSKILLRFRTCRIKEVDYVFDAYAIYRTRKQIDPPRW
jgi:hypothetical protein